MGTGRCNLQGLTRLIWDEFRAFAFEALSVCFDLCIVTRHHSAMAVLCRQAADELLKSKGIGKDDEGPVTYKYVDMNKTADSYDKVRQYQETGKKTF